MRSHDVQLSPAVPGKHTLVESLAVVQRVAAAPAEAEPGQVHAAAQHGIAGGSQPLPHAATIQQLFGRHDVSGVEAHVGGPAAEAAGAMGATAYATGNHVAFANAPDLHTAAHEAAHVVQQRAGVQLKGGVGATGDAYEQHADAVADRVVAGQSAEALLDRYAGGGGGAAVQRAVKGRKGAGQVTDCNSVKALWELFAFTEAGQRAYAGRMKDLLFNANVLPAAYQAAFGTSPGIKEEVGAIVTGKGANDLIKASASPTIISVPDDDGTALANQLFAIIGPSMTAPYLHNFPHIQMVALGLDTQGAKDYVAFVQTKRAKLKQYEQAKQYTKHDKAEHDKNESMDNRISVLTKDATALEGELRDVLTGNGNPAPVIAKLNRFRTDIALIEHAMDLDHETGQDGVTDKLSEMKSDTTPHNGYATGGTDDGVKVEEGYEPLKACSLFALLALIPGFKGAGSPEDLHKILRKTKGLTNYDDDDNVAKIRLSAGLKPTMKGGARLETVVGEFVSAGKEQPFIVDPSGAAHTFAVVWKDSAYRRVDNESSTISILTKSEWKSIPAGTIWTLG